MGVSLTAFWAVISLGSVPGVRDGTQKEGRADLVEDYEEELVSKVNERPEE
jgi:hypothetical protein